MTYQSLYRRYRPQRFEQLKGQDHVGLALRNAVRDGMVVHAYLFSGPRGTGKTSTARILAKALNCEHAADGEPDDTCQPCLDITAGSSLDVFELDAASNNGVDAMRDLLARASLGTPGRRKVYIVDEVHMLSAAASNALLKTLEEAPEHVVFVLATTDPQKVLPTVRSRAQHFEFRLVAAEVLGEHLRWVVSDSGLEVSEATVDAAVRRGHGSVRDALSALDQLAVGGTVDEGEASQDEIIEALCEHDAGLALKGVAERRAAGIEPRQLAGDVLDRLRDAFLVVMAPDLVEVPHSELEHLEQQARRLGPAATVRAMELLGETLVAMKDAPDPRVLLEACLVRLCHPESDASSASLLQRIERLERQVHDLHPTEGTPGVTAPPVAGPPPVAPAPRVARPAARPPPAAVPPPPATAPAPAPVTGAATTGESSASPAFPSREELTLAWADHVLGRLPAGARALYRSGRFVSADGASAVYGLPNAVHRDRCELRRHDVEAVLADHFGRPVPLRLIVPDDDPAEPPTPEPAWPAGTVTSPLDHVMQAFEGAEVVEE